MLRTAATVSKRASSNLPKNATRRATSMYMQKTLGVHPPMTDPSRNIYRKLLQNQNNVTTNGYTEKAKTANVMLKAVNDSDYFDALILLLKNKFPKTSVALDKVSTFIKLSKNIAKFANFLVLLALCREESVLLHAINDFTHLTSQFHGGKKNKTRRRRK